jgi:hypothetical protein
MRDPRPKLIILLHLGGRTKPAYIKTMSLKLRIQRLIINALFSRGLRGMPQVERAARKTLRGLLGSGLQS